MPKRTAGVASICLLCAASIALGGCDMQIDESTINAQADYSIDIALPYATVTPEPMEQEQAQALVIDSNGGVTVNDSTTILQGEARRESDNSNYSSLRLGNTGLAVQALQMRLQELGYYSAGISGVFDSNTEAAVRLFEQSYGTMQTGVATVDLQTRLFAQDALIYGSEAYNEAVIAQYRELQRGDVGSSVYALQQRLRNLNYPITNLSGIYDNETANAVMLFYEAYGLTASDVASVALQRELYSNTARAYSGAAAQNPATGQFQTSLSADTVAEIQQRLIDLGYLSGTATGQQDAATQIAVKLFEQACGQLPSGMLSEGILALLRSDRAPSFDGIAQNYTNLIEGATGEEVRRLQARLVELGFAIGTPNGVYGSATSDSIRLFQSANGMEVTGVGSAYLQAVLYSSFALNIDGETIAAPAAEPTASPDPAAVPVAEATPSPQPEASPTIGLSSSEYLELSESMGGEDVLRLQNRLIELGYNLTATGNYDEQTQKAVSAFQKALGHKRTGVATADLQNMLYSAAAPRKGRTYFAKTQSFRKLSLGKSGTDVAYLQARLWSLGYLKRKSVSKNVGSYNEATQQAVAALQADIGYEFVDGTASAELQCYLYSKYCKKKQTE